MNIHQLMLGALTLVTGACVPFLGPLPPDGGDGHEGMGFDSASELNSDGHDALKTSDGAVDTPEIGDHAPSDAAVVFGSPGTLISARAAVLDGTIVRGAVLPDDSVVLVGTFKGLSHFGVHTLTTSGDADVFLARYGSDGVCDWAIQFGGPGDDDVSDVAVLADGSIAVFGDFIDNFVFGQGSARQTTIASIGGSDLYLAKFTENGDLIWGLRAGGTDTDGADGLVAEPDGGMSITGYLAAGAGVTGFLKAGDQAFVAQLDANGKMSWSHSYDLDVVGGYKCLAVTPEGETIFCGYAESPLSLWEGDLAPRVIPGPIPIAYVAAVSSSGAIAWTNQATMVFGGDYSGRFVVPLPGGDVAIGGTLYGSQTTFQAYPDPNSDLGTNLILPLDAALHGAFVARYDSSGHLGPVATLSAIGLSAIGAASAGDGTVVVSGTFDGVLSEMTSIRSSGGDDVFLANVGIDGHLVWVAHAGGLGDDSTSMPFILSDGSIVLVGNYTTPVTSGKGEAHETLLSIPSSGLGVFFARFSP